MYNYDSELPSLHKNDQSYMDYWYRLKGLATTMFEWKGLPDTVSERYLEDCLFYFGSAVFFYDDSMGWLALQGMREGVNVYGDPTRIRPISPVKNFDAYDLSDCVLIKNTWDMFPTIVTTSRYAESLWDIDVSRNVNIKAQKTPILVLTDDKQLVTMQNIYKKYNGNDPVIFGNKNTLDPNSVRVLRTDAPFVAAQLQDMKLSIYNEYLMMLGIAKANQDKKERFVTSEVEQYEREANSMANILLTPRKEAAKMMSELSGYEITVDLRADLDTAYPFYATSVSESSAVQTISSGTVRKGTASGSGSPRNPDATNS